LGTEARLECQRWPPGIATCGVRAGSAGSAAPLGTSSPSSTSGDASRREHRSFIGSSPRRAEVTRRPPSTRRSSPRESTTTERPSPHGGQPNSGLGATRRPKPARRARTDRCERLRTCVSSTALRRARTDRCERLRTCVSSTALARLAAYRIMTPQRKMADGDAYLRGLLPEAWLKANPAARLPLAR